MFNLDGGSSSWPWSQECGSHRPQQSLAVAIAYYTLHFWLTTNDRLSSLRRGDVRHHAHVARRLWRRASGDDRYRRLMHSCCNSRMPGRLLGAKTFDVEAGYGCTLLCQTTNRYYCNRAGRCRGRGRRAIAIAVAAAAAAASSDLRLALQSGGGRPFVESSRFPSSWTGGVRSPGAKGNTDVVCRHEPWEKMGRTNDRSHCTAPHPGRAAARDGRRKVAAT